MTLLDLCVQLWHTLVVERYLATHQDVENDAKAPHVHFWSCVLFGLQKLRSSKVETATKRFELVSGREQIAEAKIDNLNVASLADEDVLDLEVSMDDAVSVAVVERAGNLAGELAGLLLLETAVRDDIVEHLASIDKLKQHVPVVVCAHDISHATDVGVVEQADNGGFSGGSNLFGVVCSFAVGGALVLVLRLSRDDLNGDLGVVLDVHSQLRSEAYAPNDEGTQVRTCSPVSECFASLTLPMLPAPMVLPSAHVPVLGAVMVVLLLVPGCCTCADLPSAATPLTGMADAVDASDAYRAWLLLLDSVRVGVGAGASRDSLRRTPSFAMLVCSQSRAATLLRPCCCGRECEWLVGREVVLWERWGRSEGLAWACGRRAEGCRTTEGDEGVAVDMVPVRLGQVQRVGLRANYQRTACHKRAAMRPVGSGSRECADTVQSVQ